MAPGTSHLGSERMLERHGLSLRCMVHCSGTLMAALFKSFKRTPSPESTPSVLWKKKMETKQTGTDLRSFMVI